MRLFFFFIPLVFLAACSSNVVYSEYKSIPENEGWAVKNKLSFEADIKDSIHRHDVYITVRNADAYPYRNLFMFLETKYPDGNVKTDTIECILANEKGKWLGSGSGDLWDNSILFKKNTIFPRKGMYTFTFQQAMRYGDKAAIDPLPLILDVGITIEKSK